MTYLADKVGCWIFVENICNTHSRLARDIELIASSKVRVPWNPTQLHEDCVGLLLVLQIVVLVIHSTGNMPDCCSSIPPVNERMKEQVDKLKPAVLRVEVFMDMVVKPLVGA
jgi:hypothetical protein